MRRSERREMMKIMYTKKKTPQHREKVTYISNNLKLLRLLQKKKKPIVKHSFPFFCTTL